MSTTKSIQIHLKRIKCSCSNGQTCYIYRESMSYLVSPFHIKYVYIFARVALKAGFNFVEMPLNSWKRNFIQCAKRMRLYLCEYFSADFLFYFVFTTLNRKLMPNNVQNVYQLPLFCLPLITENEPFISGWFSIDAVLLLLFANFVGCCIRVFPSIFLVLSSWP